MPQNNQHKSPVRKHAAIMFTDIVGYTALMGKDEEKTLDLLRQFQTIQTAVIDKYDGTFVKKIGDGLLAYFSESKQAVLCSIEIQNNLEKYSEARVRIGLHWAEIFIEDEDIYGDGVNIASRIESLADPGGVYVSEDIRNSLEPDGQFRIKHLGKAKLKNVRKPVIIFAIQGKTLPIPSMKRFVRLAKPRKKFPVVPTIIAFSVVLLIAFTIVKYLDDRAKVIEAEASLEKIEDLMDKSWRDYSEAYYLAKEAESTIPDNPELKDIIKKTSVKINISTEPSGAEVFYKLYKKPEDDWKSLGLTPIDSVQLPISSIRWKIEKEGYETVLAASMTYNLKDLTELKQYDMFTGNDFHRILDKKGSLPPDMTRVAGRSIPPADLGDFFIDKYEVSNRKYKKFIEQGGYENPVYWKELAIELGDSLDLEETMQYFVDQTGLPGPSTWENQNFPTGQGNHPVTGISWFEANAYASFAGKFIPTKYHWGLARGEGTNLVMPQLGGNALFTPFSNFHGDGPIEVGSYRGFTSYGVFDMAGNVREWCWNESEKGRWMRGGAWNDNPYMFGAPAHADPFDRSDRNGFRCALYPDPEKIPEAVFIKADFHRERQYTNIPEPVTDEQFEVYKVYFEYDKIPLKEEIVSRSENEQGWILEKVEFDAAYDNERMVTYCFLPLNTEPPYQTVLYGPGSNVLHQKSSDDIENFFEFTAFCEFLVKNGRALILPVFKGSFERKGERNIFSIPPESHQFTTHITRIIKDYRRCLDYMETREDFNMEKVAFYGMSMGPHFGIYLSAVDSRIKTNIFYAGSMDLRGRSEINMAYFIRRINTSTLMINGRYDALNSLDNIMTLYNLLGTTEQDKKLILHESDHLAPVELVSSEVILWLDQHFGEVKHSIEIQRLREPVISELYN